MRNNTVRSRSPEPSDVRPRRMLPAAAEADNIEALAHGLADAAPTSLREARQRFEREYIAAVLERHEWRMSEAARALGIERANLYRKTRQLGIARTRRARRTSRP